MGREGRDHAGKGKKQSATGSDGAFNVIAKLQTSPQPGTSVYASLAANDSSESRGKIGFLRCVGDGTRLPFCVGAVEVGTEDAITLGGTATYRSVSVFAILNDLTRANVGAKMLKKFGDDVSLRMSR